VLSYDRRGHSESTGVGSVHDDVNDLAALIESLRIAPAFVAGNSFGSAITLRLAASRPDLVLGIVLHEPPLFPLLADDPKVAGTLQEVVGHMGRVVERIMSGDHAGAAAQFMTELALAPGEWEQLPNSYRQTATDNALTFLEEANDPDILQFDPELLKDFRKPILLTLGERSPSNYGLVLDKLAGALPDAERLTFANAGHLPHVTHPTAYVDAIKKFIQAPAR
jgi:pimeloyl-ACP methyl ester carboxylesterase